MAADPENLTLSVLRDIRAELGQVALRLGKHDHTQARRGGLDAHVSQSMDRSNNG